MEKMMPKYEREVEKEKEKIREIDSKVYNHTYIKSHNSRENEIDIDQLVNNMSLEELKSCSERLKDFQDDKFYEYYSKQLDTRILLEKRNKTYSIKLNK